MSSVSERSAEQPMVIFCSDEEEESVQVVDTHATILGDAPASADDFSRWWPDVGRTLVDSLYHRDRSVRRNAVCTMMPITERFPRAEVLQLTVTTPDIKRLHELYALKLVMMRKRLDRFASVWIDKLDELCQTCRQQEARVRATKDLLLKKAEELVAAHGVRVRDIVSKQLVRAVQQMEQDAHLHIQIARLQAHTRHDVVAEQSTVNLERDIQQLEHDLTSRFPPEILDSLRQTYAAHVRNLNHEVANRVQQRCRCEWVHGLELT